MNRTCALAAVMIAATTVAFFSGASVSSSGPKPTGEIKLETKPAVTVGQRTAVFNMAAVMREFNLAKYQVWALNNKKTELSKSLNVIRADYIETQTKLKDNPNHPLKQEMEKKMQDLTRKAEATDREITQKLNNDASTIISDLYDKMKEVVEKIAKQEGFQIVFAYPDAVTPEEKSNPQIKELKLKPPAAQPFYVDPEIDITARVVKALNEKYPPIDPKTNQPVDMSELTLPVPVQPTLPPGVIR